MRNQEICNQNWIYKALKYQASDKCLGGKKFHTTDKVVSNGGKKLVMALIGCGLTPCG